MAEFLSDVETLRRHARAHMDLGPITEVYGAGRKRVIEVRNEVLATERVCGLRWRRHHYMARRARLQSRHLGGP